MAVAAPVWALALLLASAPPPAPPAPPARVAFGTLSIHLAAPGPADDRAVTVLADLLDVEANELELRATPMENTTVLRVWLRPRVDEISHLREECDRWSRPERRQDLSAVLGLMVVNVTLETNQTAASSTPSPRGLGAWGVPAGTLVMTVITTVAAVGTLVYAILLMSTMREGILNMV